MRLWADFNHGRCERESRPRRQVLFAQIQIEIELTSRQLPAVFVLGHQRSDAGIHDVELHVRMCRSVRRERAAAGDPAVAHQAHFQIKLACVKNFSFVARWPAHNQLEVAFISGSAPDLTETSFEFYGGHGAAYT